MQVPTKKGILCEKRIKFPTTFYIMSSIDIILICPVEVCKKCATMLSKMKTNVSTPVSKSLLHFSWLDLSNLLLLMVLFLVPIYSITQIIICGLHFSFHQCYTQQILLFKTIHARSRCNVRFNRHDILCNSILKSVQISL